jgi:hypothetical protein
MSLLNWKVVDIGCLKPILVAEVLELNMDFLDLCEGRYWGGHTFYLQIKFSIHERIVKDHHGTHQLLAPNGIHVFCHGVDEAKEVASTMYRRILEAVHEKMPLVAPEPPKIENIAEKLNAALKQSQTLTLNFNEVISRKRLRNMKDKAGKLLTIVRKRGIDGRVWFSRIRKQYGWMFSQNGSEPIPLGDRYPTAIKYVESGCLDKYKGVLHEERA